MVILPNIQDLLYTWHSNKTLQPPKMWHKRDNGLIEEEKE